MSSARTTAQNQNAPLIQELVDKIVALYDPARIILFGSRAKGTSVPASDVDLLIVKDTALPRSQRGLEVHIPGFVSGGVGIRQIPRQQLGAAGAQQERVFVNAEGVL